jgi:glycosyltransferase involved in cell wall biosynthesis
MLAILSTHPIQYQVPLWRLLAGRSRVPFRVLYMSHRGLESSFDPGFGRTVAWDIDLAGGYPHELLDTLRGENEDTFLGLRLKPGFAQFLRSGGYRALWVQGWQVAAYWQAVWAARKAGLEVWLRGDTNLRSNGGAGKGRFVKRLLLHELFRRTDKFLFTGTANREFYLARGVAPASLVPAPHCVDNGRFGQQARKLRPMRMSLRRQWGIPDDAFCVLFVGKLQPKKRPFDIAEGCRLLAGRRPDRRVHLMFVGTGELEAELRAHCPAATFAGFLNQTELARAYVAADCLVLASEAQETWGLVVNEAMASGLPAVVSGACGCAEDLVQPLRPSMVFPVGDRAGLCSALEAALDDPPSPD